VDRLATSKWRAIGVTNGILLTGRLLLAACLLPPAIMRMQNISGFSRSLGLSGLPYPDVLAAILIVGETFGPVALILGLAPRLTASILLVVAAVTTATIHPFWKFVGLARQTEQALFMAQAGMLAALLFYMITGPGAWSLQAWWTGGGGKAKSAKKKPSRPRAPRPRPAPARPDPADDEMAEAA
jgi:putative oxidoreductase